MLSALTLDTEERKLEKEALENKTIWHKVIAPRLSEGLTTFLLPTVASQDYFHLTFDRDHDGER